MTRIKSLHQKITLNVILTLLFTSLIGYSSLGQTEPDFSHPESHPYYGRRLRAGSHDKQLPLPPPDAPSGEQGGAGSLVRLPLLPTDGPPGNRKGAATHGPCEAGKDLSPLTAIVPEWQDPITGKTYVLGRTTSAHPTFWFYVPYKPKTHAEFVLQDEEQYTIDQASFEFELVGTPGVVSFTLPLTQAAALATNNNYFWYFEIKCDPQGTTDDFVRGWVQRVEQSPDLDENDIWYDALTNLDTVPTDLLQRAGLSDLEPQPIVQQYTPSQ